MQNTTTTASECGKNGHRKGPPPLHPVMKAVTAQAAELLGVIHVHDSQVDDPFQRRDGLPLARRLWQAHGGCSRLIVVRLPGHYRLDRAEDALRLQADAKAQLRHISGGLFAWGAVEVSEQFTDYRLTDDGTDVVGILHGTGAHLAAVISADVPLPEGVQLADDLEGVEPWDTLAVTVYDVAHWVRYHRKGYDQRMNSVLENFAAGSFTPPCPVKLALAAHDNGQVRLGLWLLWWNDQRRTRSKATKGKKAKGKRPPNFPPMQFMVNDPKQKQAGKARAGNRYVKEQELSDPLALPDLPVIERAEGHGDHQGAAAEQREAEPLMNHGRATRMLSRLLNPRSLVRQPYRTVTFTGLLTRARRASPVIDAAGVFTAFLCGSGATSPRFPR